MVCSKDRVSCTVGWALGVAITALSVAHIEGATQKKDQDKAVRVNADLTLALGVKLDQYLSVPHPADVKYVASKGNAKGVKWTGSEPSEKIKGILEEMKALVDVRHVIPENEVQNLLEVADANSNSDVTLEEIAEHLATKELSLDRVTDDYERDSPQVVSLLSKHGIVVQVFSRLYRFCHQNFYRQLVMRIKEVGEAKGHQDLSYQDAKALLKESEITVELKPSTKGTKDAKGKQTTGGEEVPETYQTNALNRITKCMETLINKCKKGDCKVTGGSLMDIFKIPFMSSYGSSMTIFHFNRPGQNM